MNKLFILIFLISLAAFSYPETNFNKTYFLWEKADRTNGDFIESIPDYRSAINWTTGKLRTEVHIPAGKAPPNLGKYYNDNNNIIKDELQRNLMRAIGYIRISDIFFLKDYFSSKNDLQGDIIYAVDNAFYYPIIQRGDQFVGFAEINFYGDKGISEIFSRDLNYKENTNYLKTSFDDRPGFDGLVIDTGSLDYNPSLQMRIYDEDGVLLYGPETMDRDIFLKEGVCEYTTSLSKAFTSPRSGTNSFYTLPFDITGLSKCNFVIDNSDASTLFGNRSTLKSINNGNVVVVKNPSSPEN